MPAIAPLILSLLQAAPGAITEITALYTAIKGDLSTEDQATIDSALAAAQSGDAQATAAADVALDQSAQR